MKEIKAEEMIVYGVVPHNFGEDGFKDVTRKLDYLADLGVNALWIAPANETPTGGHGYDVSNYYGLRQDYGTQEEFKEMIDEAHKRGIKVLMDFVPNHTSIDHPYMKDALAKGKDSQYYDFYDWDEEGNITHYFDWDNLPNLNFDNLKVVEWIIDALSYWVREFDIDGYRIDVAWGIKWRRPDFWPALRQALDRIKPEIVLIAEASARDPYYYDNGFEVAYDWTDELGHWSMENVFDDKENISERLHAALTNDSKGFHENAIIFRFLNNNDTAERFITRYGLDLTKVAAVMLLTLPGTPCIYTGQEVGAEYEPYKTECPISWEDKHGLRDYYKKLVSIRKNFPCMTSSNWERLKTDADDNVYVYLRVGQEGQESSIVMLNLSNEELEVEIDLPDGFKTKLNDILSNEVIYADTSKFRVGKYGAKILVNA